MPEIVDGTPVDAATTNPAFLGASVDDTATGKISFNNSSDPTVSGSAVNNIQREANAVSSWIGKALNVAYNSLPTFTNSQGFTASESLFARLEAVSQKFFNTSLGGGHSHDGSNGGGAPIQSASISGVQLHGYIAAASLISSVTGSSTVVTSTFTGKTPSGGDTFKGVVVLAPQNKVIIRQGSGANTGDSFVDGSGNIVYGRLTFSSGVWTLSYFVDISGTETAYSFGSSVTVQLYYQELFNPVTDAPIYSEYATVPSDNSTADVIDATSTQRGLMSAGTQSLGGNKTWVGTQLFQAVATFAANVILQAKLYFVTTTNSTLTGSLQTLPQPATTAVRLTNASLVSIQEISGGSDGAFFMAMNQTGADVTLKNETGTAGNQIRTGTGADFTFKSKSTIILYYDSNSAFWYLAGGGGTSFSLAAVGSSPNANAASYNTGTGVFNLQPADSSNPGVMTAIAQTLSGVKTWASSQIFQALVRFDTTTDSSTTGANADLPAPSKGVLRISNASLTSIQRILTMGSEQVAVLMNKTGASVTLINNFGANGFLTGTGSDMVLANNASVLLVFDSVSSRVMIVGGSGGIGLSLAAVGSSPNANGASYNSGTGVLTLQPADSSNPGLMTAIAQSFAGAKTWAGNMIMQALVRFDTATDSTTTGSNADLTAPTKGVLRLTNASLVSIQRVLTMANEQVAVLMNKTGASITLINNFGANGFLTGTGVDLVLPDGASVLLVFDSVSSRVMVVSGSGGSSKQIVAVQTVSSGGTITSSQQLNQLRYVKGASGGVAASITPFGTGGWVDGTVIECWGESDTDFLDITLNDANYGVLGNFATFSLTNNKGMRFLWKNSALRWLATPL